MARVNSVFLSHTNELSSYPRVKSFVDSAKEAVRSAGMIVSEMSHFTARDQPPADYCRDEVSRSDLYVAIIGFNYGSPVSDLPHLSYTELEFETATHRRMPRLIFLISEDAPLPRYMFDVQNRERQDAFRDQLVNSGLTCSVIETADELERKLHQALVDIYYQSSGADTTASPRMLPAQLPAVSGVFTGRDEVTAQIIDYLASRSNDDGARTPVVVVAGPGGMGKTTVALHAAHAITSSFEHGQLYVDLSGDDQEPLSADEVLGTFLRDLGVPGDNIPDSPAGKAKVFRSALAPLRMLLFLDNAYSDQQVALLLPGTGESATIVTSRQRLLSMQGAHVFELDVLSAEHGLGLLAALIGNDRCEQDLESARRIVRLCGGLPLALAIAGARLASRPKWSLKWFATQLSDERHRLDLLELGNLAVRSAFALSFRHLPADLQETFRTLGIWTGPDLTAWVVAAMTEQDPDETEHRLGLLVDAQLVQAHEADEAGYARYRLHDLLHDYASELADGAFDSEARWAALERGAHAYAAAITTHGSNADWIRRERIGIERAIDIVIARGMNRDLVTLALARASVISWPAEWQQWRTHLDHAERAADGLHDRDAQLAILTEKGRFLREIGHFHDSEEMLQRALELADPASQSPILQCLGDTYRHVGRLHEAMSRFQTILDSTSDASKPLVRAQAQEGSGDAARGLSKWEDATKSLQAAAQIYQMIGDVPAEGGALCRLAMVFRDQMRYAAARETLTEALATIDGSDDRWIATIIRQLGIVERNDGRFPAAWPYFERAREGFLALVDLRSVAMVDRNMGDQLRAVGELDESVERLQSALQQFRTIDDVRWAARSELSLADTRRQQQERDRARKHQRCAAETFASIADRPAQGRAWRTLALIERDAGQRTEAARAFSKAAAIFRELTDVAWLSKCLASWSTLDEPGDAKSQRRIAEAAELLSKAGLDISEPWSTIWREW